MADEPDAEMQAKLDKILALAQSVAEASSGANPLENLQKSLDQIEAVRREIGLPGYDDTSDTDQLRQSITGFQQHFGNLDAAMWAGDLERAKSLEAGFDPSIGLAGLDDGPGWEGDAEDDGAIDLSEFLAELAAAEGQSAELPPDDDLFAEYRDQMGAPDVTDLYAAIEAGEPGAIDAFIATGTDPNTPSGEWQRTALHAAIDAPGRRVEGLQKLVDAGADPQVRHFGGDSLLAWSLGYHHPATVTPDSERALIAWLVRQGLDPNAPIPHFGCALARAIIQGNAGLVQGLLDAGADADARLPDAFEPAFLAGASLLAVAAPKPDVIRVLLAHGADPVTALPFVADQFGKARDRADPDDPWTTDFVAELETSLALMQSPDRP